MTFVVIGSLAPAAATAAGEDDDGGVVVADQARGSQVQVLDPREIALRILLVGPARHAAAVRAHDDVTALDDHVGEMRPAAHIDTSASTMRPTTVRSVCFTV